MDDSEQTLEIQSPSNRAVVIASVACFASMTLFYWGARPAVELLEVGWAEILIYAVMPLAVTFIILYRSSWHREINRVARTGLLLLLSCFILGGEIVASGFMVCLAIFCFNAIQGGNH